MNQRDVELLSAYLDGQLKPSDSARLESRLKSEPELVSVMDDLRAARNLLRRLPQRRARVTSHSRLKWWGKTLQCRAHIHYSD